MYCIISSMNERGFSASIIHSAKSKRRPGLHIRTKHFLNVQPLDLGLLFLTEITCLCAVLYFSCWSLPAGWIASNLILFSHTKQLVHFRFLCSHLHRLFSSAIFKGCFCQLFDGDLSVSFSWINVCWYRHQAHRRLTPCLSIRAFFRSSCVCYIAWL